jgi:deoxyribodipyrimidine photolyase
LPQIGQICAKALAWSRRGLRIRDHAAYYHALKADERALKEGRADASLDG